MRLIRLFASAVNKELRLIAVDIFFFFVCFAKKIRFNFVRIRISSAKFNDTQGRQDCTGTPVQRWDVGIC